MSKVGIDIKEKIVQKTVAFDIDGCMNYLKEDILLYGKIFYSKKRSVIINESGYYFRDVFSDVTDEEYNQFWEEYGYELYMNSPREGVVDVVHKLQKDNIRVILITSRQEGKKYNSVTLKKMTEMWMKKNDIEVQVFFTTEKGRIVRSENVLLMIEDKVKNIISLSKLTDVMAFSHKYNENLDIAYISTWKDAYNIIKSRLNENDEV